LPTYGYLTGISQDSDGAGAQSFIASIMTIPWGRWVIGFLGLAVIIGGLYQIYIGLKPGFDRQFQIYALTPGQLKLATYVGRFGTLARGVVFALTGGLISFAAYRANPSQPIGIETALATLLFRPYGIWLLGVIALGLIAFGIYSMLSAFWLRLKR
jgi:hypothetical protein